MFHHLTCSILSSHMTKRRDLFFCYFVRKEGYAKVELVDYHRLSQRCQRRKTTQEYTERVCHTKLWFYRYRCSKEHETARIFFSITWHYEANNLYLLQIHICTIAVDPQSSRNTNRGVSGTDKRLIYIIYKQYILKLIKGWKRGKKGKKKYYNFILNEMRNIADFKAV